jgi:hypothetical protein
MHRASVFPVILLAGACGGGAAPTGATANEPGPAVDPGTAGEACPGENGGDAPDTRDGAMALAAGTHAGCFAKGDTRDTYALEAPEGQPTLYRLRFEGAPATQGCFTMFDAGGAEPSWSDRCAASAGASKEAWALVAPGTTWFLQVHDLSGNAGSEPRAYQLSIEASPIPDGDEPNDAREQATALNPGDVHEGWFHDVLNGPAREVDVYAVEAYKPGELTVTIEEVPPEVHFAVTIFDASGKRLHEKGASNPGAAHTVKIKVKKGRHLIELRNIAGAGTPAVGKGAPPPYATKPYRITVTAP